MSMLQCYNKFIYEKKMYMDLYPKSMPEIDF